MSQYHYFAAEETANLEKNRLLILEQILDAQTIRLLEMIGVQKGWRCLEIGAGAGSIARWIAEKAGAEGKVVATDINPRFLFDIGESNLEVRQHDIQNDYLDTNQYDLVHSRALLMHLTNPEEALNKMVAALRPGGWLLVEDLDFAYILTTDLTNPSAKPLVEFIKILWEEILKNGTADPYFGRKERCLVEKLGLENVGHDGWTRINRGGGLHAQFAIKTLRVASKPMIMQGILDPKGIEIIEDLYNDPDFYWPEYTLISAWGQKQTTRE